MSDLPPVLILSGASEVITIALVEEMLNHDVSVVLVGLGRPSIVRDAPNVIEAIAISWPPEDPSDMYPIIERLITRHEQTPGAGVHTFATEDGGLRFLLEATRSGDLNLHMPKAQRLDYGGLDKVELFNVLGSLGEPNIARSMTVESDEDLEQAFSVLGAPLILKPGLRPVAGIPGGFDSKVTLLEGTTSLLRSVDSGVSRFVAQEKLVPSPPGEGLFWGSRSRGGSVRGISAVERKKFPELGGSGSWVEISPNEEIIEVGKRIASQLDLVGPFEMPFLSDQTGDLKLLELNARPWLQYALASRSGLHLAYEFVSGEICGHPQMATGSWVSPERLILGVLKGSGDMLTRARSARAAWVSGEYVAPYSSTLKGVTSRWLRRLFGSALARMGRR